MFIRIFVQAVDTEEAIKHTKKFESLISNSVIGLKIEKIEQYWKIPEQYCIEYEFKDIIPERIFEVINEVPDIQDSKVENVEKEHVVTAGKVEYNVESFEFKDS